MGSLACNGPKALLCAWQGDDVATAADKLSMEKCIAGTEMQPVAACLSDKDTAACRGVLSGCLAQLGFDQTKPLACYDSGASWALVKESAAEWNKAAPNRGYIPCVFVDDRGIKGATHCEKPVLVTYDDVKGALCAAGSKAAVCGKNAKAALDVALVPDVA